MYIIRYAGTRKLLRNYSFIRPIRPKSVLVVGVALVVVGFYVQVTYGFVVFFLMFYGRGIEALVEVATCCARVNYEVLVAEGGDDGLEEADADAAALRVDAVDDVDGLEETVVIDFQLVVLLEGSKELWVGQCGVCIRNGTRDVVEYLIDLVALDAIVVLQTLVDVVECLFEHHLVGGPGDDGKDVQAKEDGQENDDSSQTAVEELLYQVFLFVRGTVKLIHKL